MYKTTFKISKMDCPSEEQMIRMKLSDLTTIHSLDFDISKRTLIAFHTDSYEIIMERLHALNFGTSLMESVLVEKVATPVISNEKEKRLLWQILFINFFFFRNTFDNIF